MKGRDVSRSDDRDAFKNFVLDQLRGLGPVEAKRMFGGFGLYHRELFFAIIADDRLYFKTSEKTVSEYLEWGMRPFQTSSRQTLKNYYEVPADVLEDDERLAEWAQNAVEVAVQSGGKKQRK